MESHEKNNTVAIFGGSGNMGQLAAELFKRCDYKVIIVDPKVPNSPTPKEVVQQANILYFSVHPISVIETILKEIEPVITPEHCIIDNATVKDSLEPIYQHIERHDVSICSTHPLFKHDQSPYKQKVIIIPFGQNSRRATDIAKQIYLSAEMELIEVDLPEHDKLMAAVQLTPHLIMRSMWHTLYNADINLKKLITIAPANFQLFLLGMFRTVIQDPKISATIITNLLTQSYAKNLATKFQQTFNSIINTNNETELTRLFTTEFSQKEQAEFKKMMSESTNAALERLINFNERSITIEINENRPGLLRQILEPFEQNNISLNALDSHISLGKVKFDFGLDPKTVTQQSLERAINALERMGCKVST